MIRRKLSQALGWMAKTLKGFLDDPRRMIGAAGLTMGAIVIIIIAVLVKGMFSAELAASALAAVIAPLLRDVVITVCAVLAVIIMTMLGFKNFKVSAMGAEVEASMVEKSAQDAAQALQDLSASVGAEKP